MGRKTVLVDDLDGTELPEDTKPITLSLGRTTYSLYLSEKNHEKLLKALTPFLDNAETSSSTPARSSASAGDKERLQRVRAWAQSSGYTYKNAKGEDTTLGDRGRIPQEVIDAYDQAN